MTSVSWCIFATFLLYIASLIVLVIGAVLILELVEKFIKEQCARRRLLEREGRPKHKQKSL